MASNKYKIFTRVNKNIIYSLEKFKFPVSLLNIVSKSNTIISGATGSGKTSLAKSILKRSSNFGHDIVIEDLNEIGEVNKNTTQLCSSDIGQDMKTLLSNSLRMSPDRIVLGEIRSKEITTFILALNSGHMGSISTLHANSSVESVYRMAELLQIYGDFGVNSFPTLMKIVSRNIDYIIFMKNKKVSEIINIKGSSDKGTPYYETIL